MTAISSITETSNDDDVKAYNFIPNEQQDFQYQNYSIWVMNFTYALIVL